VLREDNRVTVESMQALQRDLLSSQARLFMPLLSPLLPETPLAGELEAWDLCYDVDSRGATLFERVYQRLLEEVFGGVFGPDVWGHLRERTPLLADYYHYFDDVLLGDDESWFGDEGRSGLIRRVLSEELGPDAEHPGLWGDQRILMMNNILLGGRLPRFLGVDRGPIRLPGCRATVVQGGIFHAGGRLTTFAPSYRCVTDLASSEVHSILAGGPSGRPWSRWYASEVSAWVRFGYKTLRVEP
jgi:penicillin amidase